MEAERPKDLNYIVVSDTVKGYCELHVELFQGRKLWGVLDVEHDGSDGARPSYTLELVPAEDGQAQKFDLDDFLDILTRARKSLYG